MHLVTYSVGAKSVLTDTWLKLLSHLMIVNVTGGVENVNMSAVLLHVTSINVVLSLSHV